MPVITPGERDYLSDPSILKQVSKKNFIRENIKHLKQLERKNRKERKKSSESNNEMPESVTRRAVGKSKSQLKFGKNRTLVESKSSRSIIKSIPKSPTTQIELSNAASSTKTPNRRSKTAKTKVIQSLGAGDESNESEEIIKKVYDLHRSKKKDSRSLQKSVEALEPTHKNTVQSLSSFSPFSLEDIKREMKAVQDVDYVKLNQLVQYKPKKNIRGKSDPNKAPPTYQKGVLPRYLKDTRKEDTPQEKLEPLQEHPQSPVYHLINTGQIKINKKTKEVVKETLKEMPPPGHILISEAERKQQLNEMRKHYAELINKLYQIPVNDKKYRQIKNELESELQNLEAAISLFSKENLFVKIA